MTCATVRRPGPLPACSPEESRTSPATKNALQTSIPQAPQHAAHPSHRVSIPFSSPRRARGARPARPSRHIRGSARRSTSMRAPARRGWRWGSSTTSRTRRAPKPRHKRRRARCPWHAESRTRYQQSRKHLSDPVETHQKPNDRRAFRCGRECSWRRKHGWLQRAGRCGRGSHDLRGLRAPRRLGRCVLGSGEDRQPIGFAVARMINGPSSRIAVPGSA